jgi:hypothetical protein
MIPARIAVFLQMLLVGCIAAAASPEQEMEAEAKKLLPTLFSKCGEDYYSKRTFPHRGRPAYVIGQFRGLSPKATHQMVHRRDAEKGVEWKGNLQFTASTSRAFVHGMEPQGQARKPPELDTWSKWKPANLTTYFFLMEKRNGQINITRRTPAGITPVPCSEVPPG